MKNLFDPKLFGLQVKRAVQHCQSQSGDGYRAIAKQIGIGHATLSRVCHGKPPTVENYMRLNKWMERK